MKNIRFSNERGYEDKGWVESFYTFSFENYLNSSWTGFHNLRVLNEGILKGGKGFSNQFHKDMEILTYVKEGALEYKDNLGNINLIRPNEVQKISAGHGITYTKYNISHHLPAHFFEFWINPQIHGIPPNTQQLIFSSASKWGQWCLIASGNGRNGSLTIHQDADIYLTLLEEGEEMDFEALSDRYYWLQVISGIFSISDKEIKAGDGVAFLEESLIQVSCKKSGELLLFDLSET